MTVKETKDQLSLVDGVMIGRAAYQNPWLLAELEHSVFGGTPPESRIRVLNCYIEYMEREIVRGPLQLPPALRLPRTTANFFELINIIIYGPMGPYI